MEMKAGVCCLGPSWVVIGRGYWNRSNIFDRLCEVRMIWLVLCMVRVWDDGFMYSEKCCRILGWVTSARSRVRVSGIAC